MPNFGVAIFQERADGLGKEVQEYAITAGLVQPVGLAIAIANITELDSTIIRCSKFNNRLCYLGGQDNTTSPHKTAILYLVDLDAGSATLLNTFMFDVAKEAMIVDIVTEHDSERAWILVGDESSIGHDWSGWSYNNPVPGGVWVSEGGASATFVGPGNVYPFHQYNINHFSGADALAIGEFDGRQFTIHAMTEDVGIASFTLSHSEDSGVTWADAPGNDAPGTGTSNLGSIQYHTEVDPPYVWFSINESGTGTFSFPATQQTGLYYPNSGGWLYPLAANLRTGLVGGLFYLGSGKGAMVAMEQNGLEIFTTNSGGSSWASAHTFGIVDRTYFRGWELHRWEEWFVAVSGQTSSQRIGHLHWTTDGGSSWDDALLGAQNPLSVTYIYTSPEPPPAPATLPQWATWRDARGYTLTTLFYVHGLGYEAASAQAKNIIDAIDVCTRCAFQGASGAYNTEPIAPSYGSYNGEFQDVEDRAHIVFCNEYGTTASLEIPAPFKELFLEDAIVIDPSNGNIQNLITVALANGLCNRAGVMFNDWAGGYYSRAAMRRTGNIRTLDPGLGGPGV